MKQKLLQFLQKRKQALSKYLVAHPRVHGALVAGRALLCVLLAVGVLFSVVALSVSAVADLRMQKRILTQEELHTEGEKFDFILVLGCRVYGDGTPSPMLYDRVKTGVALYEAGLSDSLLFSGDSQNADVYDEVGAMRTLASSLGVPKTQLLGDAYGLSTYESIYRAKHLFGGKRILIVTQEFHLSRALYLAEKFGMEAYGISADLRSYQQTFRLELREIPARAKDVFLGLLQPAPASIQTKES